VLIEHFLFFFAR